MPLQQAVCVERPGRWPGRRPGRAGGRTSLVRDGQAGARRAGRAPASPSSSPATSTTAPRRRTTSSTPRRRRVGSPPNSTSAAASAVATRPRAVHQRGHLVGQRALGEPPLGRRGVLGEQSPRSRRAGAATASSGTCRPSRRRSAPRTGGTGTARSAPGRATPRRRPTCRTSSPSALVISGWVIANACCAEPAADQVDAGDDVAPLVGAAGLQLDAVVLVQVAEVVGLQQHVAELGERDARARSRAGCAPSPWRSSG